MGKSSLINRLLDCDKMLVHSESGTTRDSIESVVRIGGRRYEIVDTAGIENRSREAM